MRSHIYLICALLSAAFTPAEAGSGGRVLTKSDVVGIRSVDHPELETGRAVASEGRFDHAVVRVK